MKIVNLTRNKSLADNCIHADSFLSRFKGLMLKKNISPGSGLLIKPCSSIHMFFMRFSIDVIFIDRDNVIIHTMSGIKPWHVSPFIKGSKSVLELPEGTIVITGTNKGDKISFEG
ncbi:MAG: DUF192 domain-containing protein [Bacillota bacterium]|nr:DUF192 domain-containing protein [Bacillota bacterium]